MLLNNYSVEWKKLVPLATILVLIIFAFTSVNFQESITDGDQAASNEYYIKFMSQPIASQLVRVKVTSASEPVEGAEIRVSDSPVGSTDDQGLRTFEVPNREFEIEVVDGNSTVSKSVAPEGIEDSESDDNSSGQNDSSGSEGSSDSQDQDTEDSGQEDSDQAGPNQEGSEDSGDSEEDSDQEQSDFTGIRLSNEPEPGITNRIEALEKGEPLTGREVRLDGEVLGETNSLGQLQFKVPDRSQITVEVEGLETEEFRVGGGSSSSVTLNSPADGESYTIGPGESQNIDFSFSKPENASYRVYLNGEIYSQGDQASTTAQLSETLDPGSYTWFVRSDGQESESRSFEITREGTSINLIGQASQVDGYILEMAFEIQGEASSYDLYVNDNLEKEAQVESTNTFTREFENAGTKDIRIEALESGQLQETLQRSFETSAPPEATINWLIPSGSVDTTTPQLEYEIDAGTDYRYELYLNSQLVDVGEASGTNTHSFTPDPLPQGTHSYEVKVFDDNQREIGNTSGTFETTAERELVEGEFSYRYSSQVSQHQIVMDMEAYEDLEYTINVDGTERISEEFTGSTTTRAEDIGSLESGQSYTAEISFESLETSKTNQETVEFTAE